MSANDPRQPENGSPAATAGSAGSPAAAAEKPAAPADLPAIPFVDLGREGPAALLGRFEGKMRILLETGCRDYPGWMIRMADSRSRRWLRRIDRSFADDVAEVAARAPGPGAWYLNTAFEWGCTSGVMPAPPSSARPGSGRLVRVLDWPMDGLGRHMVAARHDSPAGEWINFTWPGFVGAIQGVAPGRFAAAFNQAPMGRATGLFLLDWLVDRHHVFRSRAELPAHLLRDVFESCPSYAEAKARLTETELCLPAFFSLAGTGEGEGCIIERREREAFVHEMPDAIANDWITAGVRCKPRRDDNVPRRAQMRERVAPALGADADPAEVREDGAMAWLEPPILSETSRLALIAEPGARILWAQAWEADGPATRVCHWSFPADGEKAGAETEAAAAAEAPAA